MEKDVVQENNEENEEEIIKLREEVIELRGKVVELKRSARSVGELMEKEEEIGEDGPIINLVQLSQKVKALVQGMLIDV